VRKEPGRLGYSYYGILGTNFIFREVKAPQSLHVSVPSDTAPSPQ
jgi:hypothetical protein